MTLHTYCYPFAHMGSNGFWTIAQPTGLTICKAPGNTAKEHPLAPFQPNTGSEKRKANYSQRNAIQ